MIIFDLDNTLFKTRLLRQEVIGVFLDFGIPEQEINKQVGDAYEFIDTSLGNYSVIKHIQILQDLSTAQKQNLKEAVYLKIKQTGKGYLFPYTFEAIKYAKSKVDKVVLVTVGNPEWQETKTIASGLGDIFTDYYYVPDGKVKFLETLAKKEKSLSINDHIQEIIDSEKIKNIDNIFVNLVDKERPIDLKVSEITNLKELPGAIDKLL